MLCDDINLRGITTAKYLTCEASSIEADIMFTQLPTATTMYTFRVLDRPPGLTTDIPKMMKLAKTFSRQTWLAIVNTVAWIILIAIQLGLPLDFRSPTSRRFDTPITPAG